MATFPSNKAQLTNVSTFDTAKRLAIESRLPNIVRSVEVRPNGMVVVCGHRTISAPDQATITSILGGSPQFIV